jgi:hypothetical protein
MDDLITLFVQSNYTEQQAEDIFEAIGLMRVFNYTDPFLSMQDLLMNASYEDPIVMVDKFSFIILNAQAYLLDRHGISLAEDTTLAFNNQVLRVLFQLQHLEDPVPVLRLLETDDDDALKLCKILEMYTNTPDTTFLQIVETVRPVCLKLLAEYLYEQEETQKLATQELPILKENIRLFTKVFGINEAVRTILDSSVIMGEEFELYLPLYDELRSLITDEQVLVETLVFLLLYSSDGTMSPTEVFTKYADNLVPDLTTANRLGKVIAEMITKMTRHKEQNV